MPRSGPRPVRDPRVAARLVGDAMGVDLLAPSAVARYRRRAGWLLVASAVLALTACAGLVLAVALGSVWATWAAGLAAVAFGLEVVNRMRPRRRWHTSWRPAEREFWRLCGVEPQGRGPAAVQSFVEHWPAETFRDEPDPDLVQEDLDRARGRPHLPSPSGPLAAADWARREVKAEFDLDVGDTRTAERIARRFASGPTRTLAVVVGALAGAGCWVGALVVPTDPLWPLLALVGVGWALELAAGLLVADSSRWSRRKGRPWRRAQVRYLVLLWAACGGPDADGEASGDRNALARTAAGWGPLGPHVDLPWASAQALERVTGPARDVGPVAALFHRAAVGEAREILACLPAASDPQPGHTARLPWAEVTW